MLNETFYEAHLNVSTKYNDKTIGELVSKISSTLGQQTIYNKYETRIEVTNEKPLDVNDDIIIISIIKDWLEDLPANKKDINIVIENIRSAFNITKHSYPNIDKHTIFIYLH